MLRSSADLGAPAVSDDPVVACEQFIGIFEHADIFDTVGGELDAAVKAIGVVGLIETLSQSRASVVWVSPTMTQVAWQTGHLALLARYRRVPLRIWNDNLKAGWRAAREQMW